MKKILIVCVLLCWGSITFGLNRSTIYRYFGPVLLEAVCLVMKDEINLLRVRAGLPERTNQQIVDAVELKYSTLTKYEWMDK